MSTPAMFEAGGCLSAEGLAAFAQAPVGQAPPELAAHVGGCLRCQDRLLRTDSPTSARSAPARAPAFRNVALIGGVLLMTLLMLGMTLGLLAGR